MNNHMYFKNEMKKPNILTKKYILFLNFEQQTYLTMYVSSHPTTEVSSITCSCGLLQPL